MSSTVVDGVIQQLSVSQAEKFDPTQPGGCPLKWWLETVRDQKPDQSAAAAAGDSGHNLYAHYFRNGKLPDGRAKMKKVVDYGILKGDLPAPGADLLVEWRGDGQEKFSPYTCECRHPNSLHAAEGKGKCGEPGCDCAEQRPLWIPLLKAKTLQLGGIPWELFIDLAYWRGATPTVMDHKFYAELEGSMRPEGGLIKTIQLPVYVLALINADSWGTPLHWRWGQAKLWELAHDYNHKTAGTQVIRRELVTIDHVLERKADIETRLIPEMKRVAKLTDQRDVPFNRKSCDAWHGCAHQSICHAFKENKVQLDADEERMFAELDGLNAEGAVGKPPPSAIKPEPPGEEDEEAKLERQLAEAKVKKAAAAKAKEEADAKVRAELSARAAAEAAAAAAKAAAAKDPASTQPVLPPDAPASNPALASEKPGDKAPKGKAAAKGATPGQVSITLTFASAAEAVAALSLLGK